MLFTHHDRFSPMQTWRQLDEWVDELHNAVTQRSYFQQPATVPINIRNNHEQAIVTAEIPGIDPQLVGITVHGDALTISLQSNTADEQQSATRQAFSRTVHLPFTIDANKTEAVSQHGLLTITLRRPESEQPKKISVKSI